MPPVIGLSTRARQRLVLRRVRQSLLYAWRERDQHILSRLLDSVERFERHEICFDALVREFTAVSVLDEYSYVPHLSGFVNHLLQSLESVR